MDREYIMVAKLTSRRPASTVALKYYMQYFDMKGQSLVESFR